MKFYAVCNYEGSPFYDPNHHMLGSVSKAAAQRLALDLLTGEGQVFAMYKRYADWRELPPVEWSGPFIVKELDEMPDDAFEAAQIGIIERAKAAREGKAA